jgi:hypothetical protein
MREEEAPPPTGCPTRPQPQLPVRPASETELSEAQARSNTEPVTPPTAGASAYKEPMVTEAEQIRLMHALSRGMRKRGVKGFTEGEAQAVYNWAHQTRVAYASLELALMGLMTIAIREDGELLFKAVDPDRAAKLLRG